MIPQLDPGIFIFQLPKLLAHTIVLGKLSIPYLYSIYLLDIKEGKLNENMKEGEKERRKQKTEKS